MESPRARVVLALWAALALVTAACSGVDDSTPATLTVTSPDFTEGGPLEPWFQRGRDSCPGENANPGLSWTPGPDGTASYALALVERDINGFVHLVHWVQTGIPPEVTSVETGEWAALPGVRGSESENLTGYQGPCPVSGRHLYEFTVWALDSEVGLSDTPTYFEVELAAQDHALAQGTLNGVLDRR